MNPPEPYTHHFADRLNQSIIQKQTPLVVGLDPRLKQLPTQLLPETTDDLTQVAIAYSTFCCGIIDVVADAARHVGEAAAGAPHWPVPGRRGVRGAQGAART